jgi:hypothetical protein
MTAVGLQPNPHRAAQAGVFHGVRISVAADDSSLGAALVFPRVAPSERSALEPIGPAEALLELAPSVLLTEARSTQAHLDVLGQLARELPCYRLETGRDFDALPGLLRPLLREQDRSRDAT